MTVRAEGLDRATLTELIDFRERLERTIRKRFERDLALLHTDVVGSTERFDQFGDVTGRGLQQRHFTALNEALAAYQGVLFNTAGDGSFSYFERAEDAVRAAILAQQLVVADNRSAAFTVDLSIRAAVHRGPTLVDGTELAGHAVNLSARVTALAAPGEILLTREVFSELSSDLRARCGVLRAHAVRGVAAPVEVCAIDWGEASAPPVRVFIQEMNSEFELPADSEIISIGRQSARPDRAGNDIVVRLPRAEQTSRISRFHVELHRNEAGLLLKSVSERSVVVDGRRLARNASTPVQAGSRVVLSDLATLHFLSAEADTSAFSVTDGVTVIFDPDGPPG